MNFYGFPGDVPTDNVYLAVSLVLAFYLGSAKPSLEPN
jgi:hypothetical protein